MKPKALDKIVQTDVYSFVKQTLDMWSFIKFSYSKFHIDDRIWLANNNLRYGKYPRFGGFHHELEAEFVVAAHWIVHVEKSVCYFDDTIANESEPQVERYMRMLEIYEPMKELIEVRTLGPNEILALLNCGAPYHKISFLNDQNSNEADPQRTIHRQQKAVGN